MRRMKYLMGVVGLALAARSASTTAPSTAAAAEGGQGTVLVEGTNGIWLCGTNNFPPTAGVIHAENR